MKDNPNKKLVLLEQNDDFFKITMDYYEKRNTFSNEFGRDFVEVLKKTHNGTENVVIVTGVKDCFCCGANLTTITAGKRFDLVEYLSTVVRELNKIEQSHKTFISAVNGYCLGGGLELAMATDYIIASEDAKFGLPEIKLGLLPGADGIKRLVRCVGKRRAMDLLLTGRTLTAKEALEWGLINEVVPKNKLLAKSEEFARETASKNPAALKATKALVNDALKFDITKKEIIAFQQCLATPYARKAISEFLNKNK